MADGRGDARWVTGGDVRCRCRQARRGPGDDLQCFLGGAFATVIGVLIPAAAAAILWFAWPSRDGTLTRGRLWSIGALAGLLGLFAFGGVAAMGQTTREDDFGVMTVT